jgi:hypothetical protein
LEDLEIHLSSRIAAISEHSIEVNQILKESIDGIFLRIDKFEMVKMKHSTQLQGLQDQHEAYVQ